MKYQSTKTGAIIETDCELGGHWALLKEEVKKEAPKKEKKAKK